VTPADRSPMLSASISQFFKPPNYSFPQSKPARDCPRSRHNGGIAPRAISFHPELRRMQPDEIDATRPPKCAASRSANTVARKHMSNR